MKLYRNNMTVKEVRSAEDYDRPVQICEDIYWVGMCDKTGAYSNSYLIVDGEEAILVDGGSRTDFPSVMIKILKTGVIPSAIVALCYQNYNPRLCGSLHHLELLINRHDLRIISGQANHMFIQHLCESSSMISLEQVNSHFEFSSGRRIDFIKTPYANSAGSFVTFDQKSLTLFSGDLFSTYSSHFDLIMKLGPKCKSCGNYLDCPEKRRICPLQEVMAFHRDMMPSDRSLKYALEQIARIPFTTIAPQHGSVICEQEDIIQICGLLSSLQGVGIDSIVGDRSFSDLGDISPLRERLSNREAKAAAAIE
jgi:flavorubredoxin